MANTYTLIQSVTVGSGGTASIEFVGIPQTYTDLLVVASLRGDAAVNYQTNRMKINGSTSNMSARVLYGAGASAGSSTITTYLHIGDTTGSSATASTFSSHNIYLPNYTASQNKSISSDAAAENNSGTLYALSFTAGLWSQTAAITSLNIYPESGNWVQYSSASLYGIKNS
jgi:hypothetical protein